VSRNPEFVEKEKQDIINQKAARRAELVDQVSKSAQNN
jgi:hypothetical protein